MTGEERLDADQLGAYFTVMEVSTLLEQAVAQQLREAGDLSPIQFQILMSLSEASDDTQRMTDIADRIVYSRSGFTYQAGQLERRGLISRSRAQDDERSTLVRLTPSGRELLEKVLAGHVALVRRLVFEHLSSADVAAVRQILGPVRDRLRAAPPRSARPRSARPRSARPRPARSEAPRSGG